VVFICKLYMEYVNMFLFPMCYMCLFYLWGILIYPVDLMVKKMCFFLRGHKFKSIGG
jgi:hypothetical protein